MAKTDTSLNVNSVSRIAEGTVIKGEFVSPTDIRIDGEFEGKIVSKGRVVAGEKAVIKGDVVCDNFDLWGKMDGTVYVKDTLSLKSGCAIGGSVNTRRLSVELGAVFNGECKTITDAEFDKMTESLANASQVVKVVAGQNGNAKQQSAVN